MEFWQFYRILRRRRWIVAAVVLAAVVVAIAIDRPGVGDFSSSAVLTVPAVQRFYFITGVSGGAEQAPPSVEAALSLIRGREVADSVIRRFNLAIRPEELQQRILVQALGPDVIKVAVTGKTPAEAVMLTNAVADMAAAADQELKRLEITLAREFLEKQVGGVQGDLGAAEDALLAFQRQNGVDLATSRSLQVVNFETETQRIDLSLLEIEARLASVRAQLKGQSSTRSDREITDNPIAQQLRSQLVGLEVAVTSELALHTEKYPSVVALRAKIQAVKDRLSSELGKVVASEQVKYNPLYDALNQVRINLETEKLALLAKKEALRQAADAGKRAMPGVAQKQVEQSRLTRTVQILSGEYGDLKKQLGQARLKEAIAQNLGSLTVADRARGAVPSLFGTKRFKLTLASVLGLLGGAGLAFFLEYLDNTLKTPENAERMLGVPALVAIPRHNPPYEEAYRRLRIALGAHENGQGASVFLVTSPGSGGGTSTVVANLARAFSRAGRRTIVVDIDSRHPAQHVHFGVPNEKGLVQLLAGEATLSDVLARTPVQNLWVLPRGKMPAETAEILNPSRMAGLLADLKQRGDVILLDAPPVGVFADALVVAPLASGVLLVLDAGQASGGIEEQVKVPLERTGARVLGFILTKVRPDLVGGYLAQQRGHKNTLHRTLPPAARIVPVGVLVILAVASFFAGMQLKMVEIGGLQIALERVGAQLVSTIFRF